GLRVPDRRGAHLLPARQARRAPQRAPPDGLLLRPSGEAGGGRRNAAGRLRGVGEPPHPPPRPPAPPPGLTPRPPRGQGAAPRPRHPAPVALIPAPILR